MATAPALTLLTPTGVPHDPNNMVSSREMLNRQVTGEGESESSRLAALEKEQRAEKRSECSGAGYSRICGRRVGAPSMWCVRAFSGCPYSWASTLPVAHFCALNEDETRDMHDFIVNTTLAKDSGEFRLIALQPYFVSSQVAPAHTLAPGARARMPLVDRVSALRFPRAISFIYGEHD